MFLTLKHYSKLQKKNQMIKRRRKKLDQHNNDESGYPSPQKNQNQQENEIKFISDKNAGKESTKSQTGYSTDADQFARSRRLLALETRWKQLIQQDKIQSKQVQTMINELIGNNFKQYESMQLVLQKAVVFLDDLQAGILTLGQIVSPNTPQNSENLSLFIDNLFTYGSSYLEQQPLYDTIQHRSQRMNSCKQINEIIKRV